MNQEKEWPLWEVFVRTKAGLEFRHVAVVDDPRHVARGHFHHIDRFHLGPVMAAGLAGDRDRSAGEAGLRHDMAGGTVGAVDDHRFGMVSASFEAQISCVYG